MMYRSSQQGLQFGRVPGGGFGCLVFLAAFVFISYYLLKGLYYMLWWAAPALIVLALIVNWRVFPDTISKWLDTLETRPISGLFQAAFAVVAFPFFALWLFLKSLGYRKMQEFQKGFEQAQKPPQDDFVEFEELETRPMGKAPEPEILERPQAPEKETPKKPEKPENPYDGFFG